MKKLFPSDTFGKFDFLVFFRESLANGLGKIFIAAKSAAVECLEVFSTAIIAVVQFLLIPFPLIHGNLIAQTSAFANDFNVIGKVENGCFP